MKPISLRVPNTGKHEQSQGFRIKISTTLCDSSVFTKVVNHLHTGTRSLPSHTASSRGENLELQTGHEKRSRDW